MGVVSPLGSDVETFWKRLIAGESGIGPVTRFDTSKYDTRFAAEVQGYRTEEFMDRKEIRRTDLFVQYAIGAAAQAVKQAGVSPQSVDVKELGRVVACEVLEDFVSEDLGALPSDGRDSLGRLCLA